MREVATETSACRLCGSDSLTSVLDFGTPYISDFLNPGEEGVRAPLHAVRCEACGLVQLRHTVNRDLLYADHYWYRSGMNESMVKALGDIVDRCQIVEPGDSVLDIGANDGTLLKFWPKDVYRVAVEPSREFYDSLPKVAADLVVKGFWPEAATIMDARLDPLGQFKIITTVACFYDADDPHAFVEAIRCALHPRGFWIVQMQDEESILARNAVDYFCHEHLCLWSSDTFRRLCHEHGLRVLREEINDVNGGSLRFIVAHAKASAPPGRAPPPPSGMGMDRWQRFAGIARRNRLEAQQLLERLAAAHNLVFGVAASTKANTLLQWCGLNTSYIQAILERDPAKYGKLTPGSQIGIVPESRGWTDKPDYYVALAWHFLDGFRQRYPDVPFITLLPEVKTYPAWNTEVRRAYAPAQAAS